MSLNWLGYFPFGELSIFRPILAAPLKSAPLTVENFSQKTNFVSLSAEKFPASQVSSVENKIEPFQARPEQAERPAGLRRHLTSASSAGSERRRHLHEGQSTAAVRTGSQRHHRNGAIRQVGEVIRRRQQEGSGGNQRPETLEQHRQRSETVDKDYRQC